MGKKLKFSLLFVILGCGIISAVAINNNLKNQKNSTTVMDKSLVGKYETVSNKDIYAEDQERLSEIASAKAEARANAVEQSRARLEAEAEAQAKADAEAKAKADALAKAQAEAKAKALADAKAKADALAKAQAEQKAKLEAQAAALAQQGDTFIQQLLANPNPNIGPVSLSILKYMVSSANRNSVLYKSFYLHYGDTKNTCVYFASEELRRAGQDIPNTVCNTGQLIDQLSAMGWKKYTDYTQLLPGDICFTTNNLYTGDPTHTYTFLGFKNAGSYDYAWVLDNQASDYGSPFHERNVAITAVYNHESKDAFQFFMRK